jgi:SpoIID/LytB domain protein
MRFRRSRTTVLALSSLASGLVVALAPATPAQADEIAGRPANGVFVVDGHGWGHGRGMSQWGAQGAAITGVPFTTILNTYYPGTAQVASGTGNMRVLLEADEGSDAIVAAAAGLAVTDIPSGGHWVLPADGVITRWRIAIAADGTLRVQSSPNGATWTNYSPGGTAGFGGPLQFDSAPIQVSFPDGTRRDYRGALRGVRTSTTTMATVNFLSMEDYLRGVVPRESPSWFHAEALKAQAVAARSYSAFKRADAPATAQWDICDSTQCQVYGGRTLYSGSTVTQLEQASTNSAIDATKALIRTYGGAPIFAEFSSSTGGWTVAHPSGFPYLSAHADPYDGGDTRNESHDWTASVPVTAIEAAYPSVGRLSRVRVLSRDGNGEWGGRVLSVTIEGTTASGAATSVSTTGDAFYKAFDWPGQAAGMRSRWWRIRPVYDGTVVRHSGNPTVIRGPQTNAASFVDVKNTGLTTWDPAALHFAVASPFGSADRYSGGDRTPGSFAINLNTGASTSVLPGQTARIQLPWNVAAVPVGNYVSTYRLMHGESPFGAAVTYRLAVRNPIFDGAVRGGPSIGATGASPAFSPNPVTRDGTISVSRTGRTSVRLLFKNTGNNRWPVGGPVRLATSGPHNRVSPSYGRSWVTRSQAAKVSSVLEDATSRFVAPGQTGVVELSVYGNNKPAGSTTETFEMVWDKQSWLPKSVVKLRITRVDTRVSRVAELVTAPSAAVRLVDHPRGTTTLTLRVRNIGANAWRVGGSDVLGVTSAATSKLRTPQWINAIRTTRLARNVTRGGDLVYPGEIGEFRVPISAFRNGAGTRTANFRPVNMASRVFYGPGTTTKVTIVPGTMSGAVVRATQNAVVPRAGSAAVFFEVRNTSNVAWPIGAAVRSAALQRGGSPSRNATWLSSTRPSNVTSNSSRRGAREVKPGEVARFAFRLAGNGRARRSNTETFGVTWDGWRSVASTITLRYAVR